MGEVEDLVRYKGHKEGEFIDVDPTLDEAVTFNCGQGEKYRQIFLWREEVKKLHKQLGQ